MKWNPFPRYWSFHRSPVNSTHKGRWRGILMFSLICAWINAWVNNREAGDLRRHRGHYDVIAMINANMRHTYSISHTIYISDICPMSFRVGLQASLQYYVCEITFNDINQISITKPQSNLSKDSWSWRYILDTVEKKVDIYSPLNHMIDLKCISTEGMVWKKYLGVIFFSIGIPTVGRFMNTMETSPRTRHL